MCITDGSSSKGGKNEGNNILVRSVAMDGNILVDIAVLLHEIGHGFDMKVASFPHAGSQVPFHMADPTSLSALFDMVAAFNDEHRKFPNAYFHTQPEFFAEVFARYDIIVPSNSVLFAYHLCLFLSSFIFLQYLCYQTMLFHLWIMFLAN